MKQFKHINPRFNRYLFDLKIFDNDTYTLKVIKKPENIDIFNTGHEP